MATMATSHGLSVLTTSCVKPPVNPSSGLSATFPERRRVQYRLDENEVGTSAAENDLQNEDVIIPGNIPFDEIASHLQMLSDDEFYDRLVALKEEQKKALKRCEQLYQEKLSRERASSDNDVDDLFDRNEVRQTMNGHVSDSENSAFLTQMSRSQYKDHVRDMSTKPPISPMKPTRDDIRAAVLSQTMPVRSRLYRERPSSAPATWQRGQSLSLDEDEWKESLLASREDSEDEEKYGKSNMMSSTEMETALSRIDEMWDNFSLEDYVTRERRHSSASMVKQKKSKNLEDNWRHRLTIPVPFKMTLRDETKDKKKTSAQLDLDRKKLEKEKEVEAECQKKFKASPAPAHIYLPLYDEIMEKNEARRRYAKQYCKEMLESQIKPFNFMKREMEKRQYRSASASPDRYVVRERKKTFRAKPVPDYLYDNTVNDKLIEEEEYRKIRMKLRSEELLRDASLPPNMAAREKMKEQKLREKAMRGKQKKHFRPKINRNVPDYDALYSEFQRELARRKRFKEPTTMEPFNLQTEQIPSRKHKVLRDIEYDEETLKENRWPYKSPRMTPRRLGILSSSLDTLPTKTTHSSQLRERKTRDILRSLTQQEREEIEEDRRRRIREMRLRKAIAERTSELNSGHERRETVRDRLRRMKEDEIARQEQYEKELQDMQSKVNRRPLLFEQQTQINAKKAAEKKFASTLHSVGLDEEFLNTHSSASYGKYSEDYEEDSFDDTAVKSTNMDD